MSSSQTKGRTVIVYSRTDAVQALAEYHRKKNPYSSERVRKQYVQCVSNFTLRALAENLRKVVFKDEPGEVECYVVEDGEKLDTELLIERRKYEGTGCALPIAKSDYRPLPWEEDETEKDILICPIARP